MSNPFLHTSIVKPPNEFPFPFPPYNIQKDFMTCLYSTLEEGKLGIFESPTGTGKSLSIICGALRWLHDHELQNKTNLLNCVDLIEKELKKYDDTTDDWLTVQAEQAKIMKFKDEAQAQLEAIAEKEGRIENIRKKLLSKAVTFESRDRNKFSTLSKMEDTPNDQMAPDNILLDQIDFDEPNGNESEEEETENERENVKIYFCSRTHSQLSQFIAEIQKSPYSNVRVVPLASRQTLCVNPGVKKLKSLSLINERCLELQKKKQGKPSKTGSSNRALKKMKCETGCAYKNKTSINDLKDEIIVKIHDVEELVSKGQQISACPYYATREAIPLSQLVVVPYNTLLHKSTREACKIKLKNNIVIIDEAHNLLDAIGNMHSSHVTGSQLCLCCSQLNQYKEKYEKLFNATSVLYLNQLIFVIGRLISMIGGKTGCNPTDVSQRGTDSKIFTLTDFVHAAEIDNFNLYKLLNFCRRSKLTHKLQGFVEKYPPAVTFNQNKQENGLKAFLKNISNTKNKVAEIDSKPAITCIASEHSNNVILSVIAFLESLTNHCEDGRIICTRRTTVGLGSIKFLLLNPAAHFQEIVTEARSVIVAGGTMQPISEFRELLFQNAGADPLRVVTFSCGHVIPAENILPVVVCNGPSGKQLDFSYQTRNTVAVMNELGRILDNVCNIVPAGVVCFYPSYEYEQNVYQHFEKTGIIEKLSKKKKIFREPKKSSDVDRVLSEYAHFIYDSKKHPDRKPNGCLLLSVIGGKLSEGLNFSDDLGRCVIVVGLPYPNIKSPELQEKMNYMDKTAGHGSGNKHYENLCMKAVNQSIGRAVRHRNDYSTVLLLDHRYSRGHIQTALPSWMKESLITCEKFGVAFSSLSKFFKSKS